MENKEWEKFRKLLKGWKEKNNLSSLYTLLSISFTPTGISAYNKNKNRKWKEITFLAVKETLKLKFNLNEKEAVEKTREILSKLADFKIEYEDLLDMRYIFQEKFSSVLTNRIDFKKYRTELTFLLAFLSCLSKISDEKNCIELDGSDIETIRAISREVLPIELSEGTEYPKICLNWIKACVGTFGGYVSSGSGYCCLKIIFPKFLIDYLFTKIPQGDIEKLKKKIKGIIDKTKWPEPEDEIEKLRHMDIVNKIRLKPSIIEEGLTIEAAEFDTPYGRVDLLGKDREGNLVVIEVKTGRPGDEAIGQCLRYMKGILAMRKSKNVRAIIVCEKRNKMLEDAVSLIPNIEVKVLKEE